MTEKLAGKPKAEAATKIVVFGVDDDCKPHAGWFPKPDADRARLAAKQLRLNVVEVTATWDGIKPGHVVLAQDALVEGWWAAVVVDRTSDKVTLRWRDYPGWPKFTVRLAAIALLNPAIA